MRDPAELEIDIARTAAAVGRSCGSCSLCCYVLKVQDPELQKPANTWCQHCRPGKGGCSIYAQRPSLCRGFACVWLVNNELLGEEWFPPRAKMVCHFRHDDPREKPRLCVEVDKRFPLRWREEPYRSQLAAISLWGLEGPEKFFTQVSVGDDRFLLLGDRVIEGGGGLGLVLPVGPHQYDWLEAESEEELEELERRLRDLAQVRAIYSEA